MSSIAEHNILAIDPTTRGIAFVALEGGRLIDWGTRRRQDGDELALIERLIDTCGADLLVLEDPDAARSERRGRTRRLLASIAAHSEARGVRVTRVSRYDVRCEWASVGKTRKAEVAADIASIYPELQPLVPRIRKVYRSEEARTEIFDALSLVLHAFPPEAPVGR